MLCLTGCMTGTNAGVRTAPCAVCSRPVRPPRSHRRTSNTPRRARRGILFEWHLLRGGGDLGPASAGGGVAGARRGHTIGQDRDLTGILRHLIIAWQGRAAARQQVMGISAVLTGSCRAGKSKEAAGSGHAGTSSTVAEARGGGGGRNDQTRQSRGEMDAVAERAGTCGNGVCQQASRLR